MILLLELLDLNNLFVTIFLMFFLYFFIFTFIVIPIKLIYGIDIKNKDINILIYFSPDIILLLQNR